MRRLNRPLRASLLAAALSAAPLISVAALAHGQESKIDLPAGPLGRSLTTFAGQRGIALSFDPALTAGLNAPALSGEIGDREGLEKLLTDSGLQLIERDDGSFSVGKISSGSAVITLSPLLVGGLRTFPYSEGMVLDQDYIESTNKGNGDIGTLLRINPAVQFSDTERTSRNQGEIRPADISINGAPYYQNLFMLDGASINNDMDPAVDDLTANSVNHTSDLPSQSQGIALDTELIESLTVYDSNVPAAFGNFTGGVVDAKTRTAGDTLRGKVWLRMARSAWDEVIIPEQQQDDYAESSALDYQPAYDKYVMGARLEGRTRGGLGMITSVTRTRSDIPLRGYSDGLSSDSDSNRKTQRRENTAASLALDWGNGEGLELGANLTYAPTENRYFRRNAKDSWFDLKSGGPVLSLRAGIDHGAWTFRNTLSYSELETERSSETDYYRNWAKSEAYDWGINNSSAEGSYGNVEQRDRKLGLRFVADRDSFNLGPTEHNLQLGISYQRREAWYKRLNDLYNYQNPRATTSCTLSDGSVDSESCSLSPVLTTTSNSTVIAGQGQYFQRLMQYKAGEFEVSGNEYSSWLQDDIRIGNWSLRPGIRIDRDSIWEQTTLSPRLAASWNILGRSDSVLTAGINRYYGRNFFSYLLREGRERLQVTKNRTSSSTAWDEVEGTTATSSNRLSDVDIPYTNEWTIGLDQRWLGLSFNLKYVNRENHDEVLRQQVRSNDSSGYYSNNVYEYTNNGRSRSNIWTLAVSLQEPLHWGRSRTAIQLALDHTDVKRNYNDYQTSWNEDSSNELIRYKGELIYKYDLPAENYNRPWTARLSTQSRIDLGHGELLWSNFLRYRAGYRTTEEIAEEDLDGTVIDVYGDVNYPRSFSWDTTLEYSHQLPREQQAYVRVECSNLLNRSNRIEGNSTSSSVYYEPGRSYWLEVGYKF